MTAAACGPRAIVVVVSGALAPDDVRGFCERVRVLLEGSEAEFMTCELGGLSVADAVTIDALARLQLTARRLGRPLRLRHAGDELQDLLAFVGLGDVVGPGSYPDSGGEEP